MDFGYRPLCISHFHSRPLPAITCRWRSRQNFPRRIVLYDRFRATNSDPALAQPGHKLPVAVTFHLRVLGARLCLKQWHERRLFSAISGQSCVTRTGHLAGCSTHAAAARHPSALVVSSAAAATWANRLEHTGRNNARPTSPSFKNKMRNRVGHRLCQTLAKVLSHLNLVKDRMELVPR